MPLLWWAHAALPHPPPPHTHLSSQVCRISRAPCLLLSGCVTPLSERPARICAAWLIWQALNPAPRHAFAIAELIDTNTQVFSVVCLNKMLRCETVKNCQITFPSGFAKAVWVFFLIDVR